MEISLNTCCRLCLSESDFNVPLFGSFSRSIDLVKKIFVCLDIVIVESDFPNKVCYKCVNKIEGYYDFKTSVKECQANLDGNQRKQSCDRSLVSMKNQQVSAVRKQVVDPDYAFSLSEDSDIDQRQEAKVSNQFIGCLSLPEFDNPNELAKRTNPLSRCNASSAKKFKNVRKLPIKQQLQQNSCDPFESQESCDEPSTCVDWQFRRDNNLLKIVKENIFRNYDI